VDTSIIIKNWELGKTPTVLESIHKNEVNIAIHDRNIGNLKEELNNLCEGDFEFRSSGDINTVSNAIINAIEFIDFPLIKQDIKNLFCLFSEVAKATSYRLLLATVNSNMCRRFHTDINDLRMLCTYKGPGTLWLPEDNINWDALDCSDDDDYMVIDDHRIQQAKTGSAIILKGAISPKEGTKAILHRSPTIEESGEKRLLLRIDTDEFANFNI